MTDRREANRHVWHFTLALRLQFRATADGDQNVLVPFQKGLSHLLEGTVGETLEVQVFVAPKMN